MIALTLISVCIVTYNHQSYITDCLNSVLAQYGNFQLEILIGDDASTDNTVSIINEIISYYQGNARLQLFVHEKNLGPAKNYQFLINKSTGDYIAHLDGDDFWLPGKLQVQTQFLREHIDCPACYTNAIVINDNKSYWGFFNSTQQERINISMLLNSGNFLNLSSLLYKAQYKLSILSFSENFIDYRIHLKFCEYGDLGYINQVLSAYRIHSATSQLKHMKDSVLLMYVDAILSVRTMTSEKDFQQSILRFFQKNFLNIIFNYDRTTAQIILSKIRNYYSLNFAKVIVCIVPICIWQELKRYIYKKTYRHEAKILYRNNIF